MPMMHIKSSIWSGFEIKNWTEDQFQSSPKLAGIWTVLRCIFVPNFEIVTSIGGELWHGLAQNGVNFDFGVQCDLEGHDQSSHKTIGILTKVFYISGPNLVILAETGDELSRGQTRDWRTDGHTHRQTDAGNDNTRRPKLASGKNAWLWQWVSVEHKEHDKSNKNRVCHLAFIYMNTFLGGRFKTMCGLLNIRALQISM